MSRLKSLALVLLIVLAMGWMPWSVKAITPQSQTVHITHTWDDAFITESGILIDTSLVTILDPNMDIWSFLVFNEVDVNYWEPLENATLRLRTSNTLSFDADSSVTIRGMKWNEVQDLRPIRASDVFSVPLTSAYVNYNTSEFYGGAWHEIDVTVIVEELIRAHHWDGDGHDGTETGDSIGFIILGAEGNDQRYFYDYLGNPAYSADLVIHWNHEPPPPSGIPPGYTYNSTLGNWTIWVKLFSTRLDMVYWNGTHEQYLEVNTNSSDVEITGVTTEGNKPASYQIIRGPGDDIFYIGRVGGNQTLFHSYDEGATWANYTLNNLYSELNNRLNLDGSLAFDSSGDLWIAWASESDLLVANYYRIHSTNVSISAHVLTFNPSVEYIPQNRPGYLDRDQRRPSLWIDGNDRKHLVHDGPYPNANDAQVYYNYKDTGAWSNPVTISNYAIGCDYEYANIVTSNNGTFMAVCYESDTPETFFKYIKTVWTWKSVGGAGSGDRGGHLVYDDDDDTVLMVLHKAGNLYYHIFTFSDEVMSAMADTGQDGQYPDTTFDPDQNKALMVYDGGADGIGGWIYDFNTETWGENFTLRGLDPGYIHTATLGVIDIGGTGAPGDDGWYAYNPDTNETEGPFDDFEDVIDFIEGEDPDPEDPNPADEWPDEGPFTRFKTRGYLFILGFFLVWGPIWFFAWKRPSGYYIMAGAIVILIGIGLLIHVGSV